VDHHAFVAEYGELEARNSGDHSVWVGMGCLLVEVVPTHDGLESGMKHPRTRESGSEMHLAI
jgi:hypothetical protein